MPAIITHHLFGEEASVLLPADILDGQEELLAFLLGNQGPDPLWARFTTMPHTARTCHQLATLMHSSHMVDMFISMRDAVARLSDQDKNVGRAFALGMAAHYLLDSTTHPLIYALQHEIVDTEASLVGSEGEVHALLESDLDAWVLWQTRRKTVLDNPSSSALNRTDRIDRVAGALVAQVAWQVFGIGLGAAEYGRAVSDYQLIYRLIDPPARHVPRILARLERQARPHSRLGALAHTVWATDDCPSANLEHLTWKDPSTGAVSHASFADLFHDALTAWPAFARRFVEGDRSRLDPIVDDINYDGVRVTQA